MQIADRDFRSLAIRTRSGIPYRAVFHGEIRVPCQHTLAAQVSIIDGIEERGSARHLAV